MIMMIAHHLKNNFIKELTCFKAYVLLKNYLQQSFFRTNIALKIEINMACNFCTANK